MPDPRRLPQVLYIEDSEEARALVRRLLSKKFVVLEAADPLDGLQLAEETRPSLVLVDHNLPHMMGSEATTRLRKLLPNTPIVIVSADVSQGARERALAAGAAGFIPKPLDETFEALVEEYLNGRVEVLDHAEHHYQAYQQELVERLEDNIRRLSHTVEKNKHLLQQNERMFAMLERRHRMLETAARVGQVVTYILDLDDLLKRTVDIICSEFSYYYSGVFLVSKEGDWAVLRAGYAAPGRRMIAENYRLPVDERSTIGACILSQQAKITLDAEGGESRFENPYLPKTRSEIALPLAVEGRALGALTVQSDQLDAFSEEDITSLQTMADQIAIAINNAQSMKKLEAASAELVRTKTFEAIATATGEAIHWVGNKAAPIPGSIRRVREDVIRLLALAAREGWPAEQEQALGAAVRAIRTQAQAQGIDLVQVLAEMSAMKPNRLEALVSVESLIEDLDIAEMSAATILEIKEGLIGPARQRHEQPLSLGGMIAATVAGMGLPQGVVEMHWAPDMPPALADERQVEQVFNNLVKNAWEALAESPAPRITLTGRRDDDPNFVLVTVKDNGPGIPRELQEKIWVSFFTTKAGSGGTGLGLSACMQIVNQHGGSLSLESEPGAGAAFHVRLPAAKETILEDR
jgi:signal transduction histidine kinase/DNA-binding NarL/FixJ family response regulator